MNSGFNTDDELDEEAGDDTGEDELEDEMESPHVDGNETEVPSYFNNLEGMDMANVDNWMMSYSESKNELVQELGKNSFQDKEELIRVIKLYTIKKHRQFEVVETCPTIWKIRCKLFVQSGCKWQLCACKRKRSGCFEITKYTGPHTCLQYGLTQDHPNLDSNLIIQEIQHLVKEQPAISISTLRDKIINKLGYTPSYKKFWIGKQKAIERVFGNWEESYNALPKFLSALQFFNPGTIVEWCVARLNNMDEVEFRRVFWAFSPYQGI